MDIFKIQSLIAQNRLVQSNQIDLSEAYLQIGVFQKGNRKKGSSNANSYEEFAIAVGELTPSSFLFKNVLFVDPNGNDSTAEKGNLEKPYASIYTAILVSTEQDLVYVFPGNYTINQTLFLNGAGKNIYFSEGSRIKLERDFMHITSATVNISGKGIFSADASFIVSGNPVVFAFVNTGGILNVEAKEFNFQTNNYTWGLIVTGTINLKVDKFNFTGTRNPIRFNTGSISDLEIAEVNFNTDFPNAFFDRIGIYYRNINSSSSTHRLRIKKYVSVCSAGIAIWDSANVKVDIDIEDYEYTNPVAEVEGHVFLSHNSSWNGFVKGTNWRTSTNARIINMYNVFNKRKMYIDIKRSSSQDLPAIDLGNLHSEIVLDIKGYYANTPTVERDSALNVSPGGGYYNPTIFYNNGTLSKSVFFDVVATNNAVSGIAPTFLSTNAANNFNLKGIYHTDAASGGSTSIEVRPAPGVLTGYNIFETYANGTLGSNMTNEFTTSIYPIINSNIIITD
jgi:hypothetical protein